MILEIYIFPQNKSSLLFSDYSADHNDFVIELQSLYVVCATGFSYSYNLFLYQMFIKRVIFLLSTVISFKTQTARNSSLSITMFWLSQKPVLQSACLDSTSDFSIDFSGQWFSRKLNYARYKNYQACYQFSFLVLMKYSRFLWSVQILTRVVAFLIK